MESLGEQFFAFAATFAGGLGAGFLYNYYCELRRAFGFKKWGTILGDIVFWLITTLMIFAVLLRGNWGEVRLYVFVGLFLGACCYYWLLSAAVSRFLRFKFRVMQKTWQLLVRALGIILTAVLFPFRLIALVVSFPLGFLGGLLKKAGKKLRIVWHNLAGRRVGRGWTVIKGGLNRLLFWKKPRGG
ncbi:MAG: Spore cortex protein YabQ (Spore_YabQ) [Firmicutes bacterium ADurb.Bin456]|nr:MAG: Spore cortex protein YabQ (Spore_YabQ) [Firmicutes bacterium ADurb.Bin456]